MKQLLQRLKPSKLLIAAKGNDSSLSETPPASRSTPKKPYKPPKVTEYGNVARLTAGVAGSEHDHFSGFRHSDSR
jgi:hypothetical protein